MSPEQTVPLTVVTGFLGVGKTTTIHHLAAQRPPDQRWVVLVNEFGEVGIDGAILSDDGSLAVQELAGGCLCCAGDAPFQITLARALAELKPDRLLLEPTGLAEAGRIIDVLRQPPFCDQVDLRATITVVDPRHFDDPRIHRRSDWRSQVEVADVLIANRCDLADDAALRDFLSAAAALYPPKKKVLTTTEGRVDAALLDLAPRDLPPPPAALSDHDHGHRHGLHAPEVHDSTGRLSPRTLTRLTRRMWSGPDFSTCGWRIPPAKCLSHAAVSETVSDLRRAGAMRIKGVFHTDRGWKIVQADADGVRWRPTAWRSDSRLEVIVPASAVPDWAETEARLLRGAVQQ